MKRRSFIGSILATVATPVLAKVAPTTPVATLLVSDDNGMTWSKSENTDIDYFMSHITPLITPVTVS